MVFLAHQPSLLVNSDPRFNAVSRIRESVAGIASNLPILFAAVDAADIPFQGGSFDVVYAYAMVHHLERVDDFLSGVVRVLAPGGKAVFMDEGYALAWQAIKRTWPRPLMTYTHWRSGISPEDLRATLAGGLREEDSARTIVAVGGDPWFQRTSLFAYLL